MEKRVVTTKLIGKEESFRILAVAEAVKLPVLLNGKPGVGKTNIVLDYMAAKYPTFQEAIDNTFILETDESTKPGEVKGRLDLKEMFQNKQWKMDSPIAKSKAVLINEIDKANSGCRNGLLSVMRERRIYNGNDAPIVCNWDIFVGTCNEIPKDEVDSPFWDRFVLKNNVERVTSKELLKFMSAPSNQANQITINIPDKADMDSIQLDDTMLAKFVELVHSKLTDRTITMIGKLTKAIMFVYDIDETEALIKTCGFLEPQSVMKLTQLLEDKAVVELTTKIKNLASLADRKVIMQELGNIQLMFEDMAVNRKDLVGKMKNLKKELQKVIKSNSSVKQIAEMISLSSTQEEPDAQDAQANTVQVDQAATV